LENHGRGGEIRTHFEQFVSLREKRVPTACLLDEFDINAISHHEEFAN